MEYQHGWFLAAFEREITEDLTPIAIGSTRIVLVRTPDGFRAFNADCPHRGAHLAYGGKLDGQTIICPFHGYRIGLGKISQHGFRVREYATLLIEGLVFLRLSDACENGFTERINNLASEHTIVPGFIMLVKAPAELVIENGFDNRHFPAVHGILNDPQFTVHTRDSGELIVESVFHIPVVSRQRQVVSQETSYLAHTFSPGLIIVQLTSNLTYTVITGATPTANNRCEIRLSLALPKAVYGSEPDQKFIEYLLEHSRRGLEQDRVMWENLSLTAPQKLTTQDAAVIEFHKFCELFQKDAPA